MNTQHPAVFRRKHQAKIRRKPIRECKATYAATFFFFIRKPYFWIFWEHFTNSFPLKSFFCQTPVLGLGLGVDFTFTWDNKIENHNNHNNPHLNFVKGTVLGDEEQGVGIRDKE